MGTIPPSARLKLALDFRFLHTEVLRRFPKRPEVPRDASGHLVALMMMNSYMFIGRLPLMYTSRAPHKLTTQKIVYEIAGLP